MAANGLNMADPGAHGSSEEAVSLPEASRRDDDVLLYFTL
jgi:hypothetical protein